MRTKTVRCSKYLLIQLYFLYSLTRQLAHCSLKYPRIHKVLEVWISEVCLDKLRLLFMHSGNNVNDVIIEGYLCYLPVTIVDSIIFK